MTFKSMLQKILAVVGTRFAGAAISLVSQIIFAHIFAPPDVGVIFLAMSAAALISLFVTAGYPALALTNLPRYHALGRENIAAAFHGAFMRDCLALTLLTFAFIAAASYFLAIDSALKTALFFGCLSVLPSVFIRYESSMANSIRRFALSYVPDFIYRPGLLLAYVALLYVIGYSPSVEHVLWAFIASNVSVAIGQAILLGANGLLPRYWNAARPALTRRLRSRAFALVVVAAVATSYSDLVTMLAGFLLPAQDVALLGISIRLAAIAGFVVQASQQFVLPDLTAALTRRDETAVHNLLMRMNIITLATIGAGLLGVVVFGNFALGLFGPAYHDAYGLLVLFLVGQSFRAFSGMNQHLLSIDGHQVKTAGACLTAFLILVCSSVLLARQFGPIGMGYAVVLAEASWTLLLASQAQRLVGRRGDLLWLFSHR